MQLLQLPRRKTVKFGIDVFRSHLFDPQTSADTAAEFILALWQSAPQEANFFIKYTHAYCQRFDRSGTREMKKFDSILRSLAEKDAPPDLVNQAKQKPPTSNKIDFLSFTTATLRQTEAYVEKYEWQTFANRFLMSQA